MGSYFCKNDDSDDTSPQATELLEFDWGYGQNERIKICKVVVLGEQCILKTQLIRQYTGEHKAIKHLEINKKIYNLQVWDVPNNVFNIRNHSMSHIYCQHASAAIIVIDTTN